ncbi:hypothetical protein GEV33_012062 [Tenebrio molitor]|uniref:Uncharacterized protein n=1 Tax=Tenebrio molitor TaxID=7067 RepID=A0A8J6L405_TENMO|nr:hypothetical protein GEV33_012062 [Tenebrio molitor]
MKMETVKTIGMCARPCNVFSFRLLRKYKLWRDRKDSEEDIDFYAMYYGIGDRKWGDHFRRKMMMFESMIESIFMKGAKIWGWKKQEEVEKMQEKSFRGVLGMDRKTPDYIVREECSSVAAWLSETVFRGRGPGASGFKSHRRRRIFFQGRNLRRAMDVCLCLLGADGRVVEGRATLFHGCCVLYSCCVAQKGKRRRESGRGWSGKVSRSPAAHKEKKKRGKNKPTARTKLPDDWQLEVFLSAETRGGEYTMGKIVTGGASAEITPRSVKDAVLLNTNSWKLDKMKQSFCKLSLLCRRTLLGWLEGIQYLTVRGWIRVWANFPAKSILINEPKKICIIIMKG